MEIAGQSLPHNVPEHLARHSCLPGGGPWWNRRRHSVCALTTRAGSLRGDFIASFRSFRPARIRFHVVLSRPVDKRHDRLTITHERYANKRAIPLDLSVFL